MSRDRQEGFSELAPKFRRPSSVKLLEFSSGIQTKDKVFVVGFILSLDTGFP